MKKNNLLPKVSIIIPVYIGSKTTERAIKSALNQTYSNIEVVIVDATINKADILQKTKDKRVIYVKNKTDSNPIKTGVKTATGEYISFLYEADTYKPSKISKQMESFKKDKDNKKILYSSYSIKTPHTKGKKTISLNLEKYRLRQELLFYNSLICSSTLFMPKSIAILVADKSGLLNKYYSPYLVCLTAIKEGYKLQFDESNTVVRFTKSEKMHNYELSDEAQDNILHNELTNLLTKKDMERLEGSEYNFLVQTKINTNDRSYKKTHKYLEEEIAKHNTQIIKKINKIKPKIFVITPVYNRAKLIKEVLDSIQDQTMKDFTYLIIDDGSKDNSGRVIAEYIKDKPNWFYFYHDNKGEAETVNFGWSTSNGEYFVQVNSDDPVKENLFAEMCLALDKNKSKVLAYCDFDIIDKKGDVIETTESPDYDFIRDLSEFSCYAASPGAFIRKNAFPEITKLKDGRYLHTNDINMLWNMALKGDFLHVSKNLATWRSHEEGISADRYKAIPEIEEWLGEFFKQDLPKEVMAIKPKCMESVYRYFISLLKGSDAANAEDLIHYYTQKIEVVSSPYINLQVGDNDLIGNKFNGHDLHIFLREKGIDSSHLVWNKESVDDDTYLIAGDKADRFAIRQFVEDNQKKYDLDNLENPLIFDLMYNKLFLDSDIVHLHLMHNGLWDLNVLPTLSRLKPLVLTVHDMWIATGDSLAEKRPDYFHPLPGINNVKMNWIFKKNAIKNSNITFVVASKYMDDAMKEYKLFSEKNIVHIPFGLNFDIFKPIEKNSAKRELGFDETEKLIMFRGDGGERKGLHYIEDVVQNLGEKHNLHFVIVGGNDVPIPEGVKSTWYGWIKDDIFMSKLYSAVDLFLMPSTRENFGMMAIEAMACGTVPVVLDGTALPETVNSPECGVSTPQDKGIYTKTVEELILNTQDLERRSKKGLKYVVKKHSMDTYYQSLQNLYKESIDKFVISDPELDTAFNNIKKYNQTVPKKELMNIHLYNKPKKLGPRIIYQHNRLRSSVKNRGLLSTVRVVNERSRTRIYNYVKKAKKGA